MADISHKNSYDEIEDLYQAGEYGSRAYLKAEAALKVKSAIDSIEQQKKIVKYTNDLVRQQKGTNYATTSLAFLTLFLVVSTAFAAYYSYKAFVGSQKQVIAIENLMSSIQKVEGAINNFSTSSQEQVVSINKLNSSLEGVTTAILELPQSIEKIPIIDKELKRIHPHSMQKENEMLDEGHS